MKIKKHHIVIAVLVILALLTYVFGLFIDVTRDASKYATISREIYETGEFINLKIHGEPYDQKPPLLFWLSAVSFSVFGLSNFSFKFPVLLVAFAGLYFTYRLGKSLYNKNTGLIASLILGTSQVYFLYCMDIHTDTILQALVTFSLWQLFDFIKTRKNHFFISGFAGIGLAMLTKGPVGALIPAFAVTGHLLYMKDFRLFADWRFYTGILITFIIIFPALLGLYNQFGTEGIRFYFLTNNLGRFDGSYLGKNNDFLFYFYNLLILFSPWMILLYTSFFFEFRTLLKKKQKVREFFTFSAIWLFLILLSLSKSKLPNYVFIIIPLMSVVTAKYIFLALSGKRKLFSIFIYQQGAIVILIWGIICLVAFKFFPFHSLWQWMVLIVMLIITIISLIQNKNASIKLLVPATATILTINFFLNQHVYPQIFSEQGSVKAAMIFNENAAETDQLYNYDYYSYELFFYSRSLVGNIFRDVNLFEILSQKGNWIFTSPEILRRIKENGITPDTVITIKHLPLKNLDLRFLNPETREEAYVTMYLIKS